MTVVLPLSTKPILLKGIEEQEGWFWVKMRNLRQTKGLIKLEDGIKYDNYLINDEQSDHYFKFKF